MEMNFYNDDFEQFLKQKADQSKMYPSEDVWKGIHRSLHSRGKWYRLGAFFLLLTALGVVGDNNILTRDQHSSAPSHAKSSNDNNNLDKKSTTNNNTIASVLTKRQTTVAAANDHASSNNYSDATKPLTGLYNRQERISVPQTPDGWLKDVVGSAFANSNPLPVETEETKDANASDVDKNLLEITGKAKIKAPLHGIYESPIKLGPLSRKRWNLQVYFSPTISFRRLNDANPAKNNQQSIPMAVNYYDINRYVNHTPSLGIELGGSIHYGVSRNFFVKAGLQFNYSRYNIKAYDSYSQKAAIALSSGGFNRDTISTNTSIRNLGGYAPAQLQNQYVELSLPVGAQLLLINGNKIQVGVAGTVQPTYLLAQNTYLLSTDYVNYAKEPSLIRKWNMNTNAEAFVSYQVGNVRWQLGPQFRYQVFSTYTNRYPIRENLMEYGIKLGVTKTIK